MRNARRLTENIGGSDGFSAALRRSAAPRLSGGVRMGPKSCLHDRAAGRGTLWSQVGAEMSVVLQRRADFSLAT